MTPDIRTIRDHELPPFVEALMATFLERADVAKVSEEVRS